MTALDNAIREGEKWLGMSDALLASEDLHARGSLRIYMVPLAEALRSLLAAAKAPATANYYCAACARAAGVPVAPQAIGVRIWGGRIEPPAPALPEAVAEAIRYAEEALRTRPIGGRQGGTVTTHVFVLEALLAAAKGGPNAH